MNFTLKQRFYLFNESCLLKDAYRHLIQTNVTVIKSEKILRSICGLRCILKIEVFLYLTHHLGICVQNSTK